MAINKRSFDIYDLLVNLILKSIITLVLLSMWVFILFVLIDLLKSETELKNIAILGLIEAILTGAVYPMVKHFLPTSKEK